MTLRWTFDERVEDGLVAGYALKRAKQMLEDPVGSGLPDPSAGDQGSTLCLWFPVDSPADRYADRMPGAREGLG